MFVFLGMIPATSGDVIFDEEYKIQEDFDVIRNMLSICPQHDLLFSGLTVIEHLQFFGKVYIL